MSQLRIESPIEPLDSVHPLFVGRLLLIVVIHIVVFSVAGIAGGRCDVGQEARDFTLHKRNKASLGPFHEVEQARQVGFEPFRDGYFESAVVVVGVVIVD